MTRAFGWVLLLVGALALAQCAGVQAPEAVASEEAYAARLRSGSR